MGRTVELRAFWPTVGVGGGDGQATMYLYVMDGVPELRGERRKSGRSTTCVGSVGGKEDTMVSRQVWRQPI